MKYLLCIIALAMASISNGQAILADSSWVTNSNGVFFKNRLITYVNGEFDSTSKRLGDTTQVLNSYMNEFKNQTTSWAIDVEVTSDYGRKIKELIRQDPQIKALIGKSPLSAMLAPVSSALVDSIYRVKIDGNVKALKFSLNAQGLRYKVDTFTTRSVNYVGDVMRLNNWLNTGKSLDLFRYKNGNWYDCSRSVQLYLKSIGPQNRDIPTPEIAGFEEVQAAPMLYDGGYANLLGRWYKWSAAKKAWIVATKPKKITPAKL